MEPYLYLVKESKYRIAISRLRASTRVLEIERGRYTRPKASLTERLCPFCNVVEDEQHFLLICKIYDQERNRMFSKISRKYENICEIESRSAFKFLLTLTTLLYWANSYIQPFKRAKFGPNNRCRQSNTYCWPYWGLSTRQPPVRPAIAIMSLRHTFRLMYIFAYQFYSFLYFVIF